MPSLDQAFVPKVHPPALNKVERMEQGQPPKLPPRRTKPHPTPGTFGPASSSPVTPPQSRSAAREALPQIFAFRLNPVAKFRDLREAYHSVYPSPPASAEASSVDEILASANAETRKLLLQRLLEETRLPSRDPLEFQHPASVETLPPLKKIEILVVKGIQLGFVLLGVLLPMLVKIYQSFINNDIFFMNINNAHHALDWLIAWLAYLDEKYLGRDDGVEEPCPLELDGYSPQERQKVDEFNRLIERNLDLAHLPPLSVTEGLTRTMKLKAYTYVSDRLVETIMYPPPRPSSAPSGSPSRRHTPRAPLLTALSVPTPPALG